MSTKSLLNLQTRIHLQIARSWRFSNQTQEPHFLLVNLREALSYFWTDLAELSTRACRSIHYCAWLSVLGTGCIDLSRKDMLTTKQTLSRKYHNSLPLESSMKLTYKQLPRVISTHTSCHVAIYTWLINHFLCYALTLQICFKVWILEWNFSILLRAYLLV